MRTPLEIHPLHLIKCPSQQLCGPRWGDHVFRQRARDEELQARRFLGREGLPRFGSMPPLPSELFEQRRGSALVNHSQVKRAMDPPLHAQAVLLLQQQQLPDIQGGAALTQFGQGLAARHEQGAGEAMGRGLLAHFPAHIKNQMAQFVRQVESLPVAGEAALDGDHDSAISLERARVELLGAFHQANGHAMILEDFYQVLNGVEPPPGPPPTMPPPPKSPPSHSWTWAVTAACRLTPSLECRRKARSSTSIAAGRKKYSPLTPVALPRRTTTPEPGT